MAMVKRFETPVSKPFQTVAGLTRLFTLRLGKLKRLTKRGNDDVETA
jgi:hypothetical protein